MDLLKLKTKLIIEQLSYLQEIERFKLFDKINKLTKKMKTEKIDGTVVIGESLSDFSVPYPVSGYFLSENKPKRRFYPAEHLKIAAERHKNKVFRIIYDHKINNADVVLGAVTGIKYDPVKKAIFWKGHLNDVRAAMNVKDKVLNQVSVTVYAEEYYGVNGLSGRNLDFEELSIVINGSDPINSISGD